MNIKTVFQIGFAVSIFFSVVSPAKENCNDASFAAKYTTYAAVDKAGPGAPIMAMLAIAGGPQSSHYQRIAELAKTSKFFNDLKTFLDGVSKEAELVLKRGKIEGQGYAEVAREMEKKYGVDWDKNEKLVKEAFDEGRSRIINRLIALQETVDWRRKPTWNGPNFSKAFEEELAKLVARSPSEHRAMYQKLADMISNYVDNTLSRLAWITDDPTLDNKLSRRYSKGPGGKYVIQDANKAARDYRNALEEVIRSNGGGSVKGSVIGRTAVAGALLGSTAVEAGTLAKLKVVAEKCGKELGISNTGALASSIAPETAILENPDCKNLALTPSALDELLGKDGLYSAGECKLLEDNLTRYADRYDKPFQLDTKNCSSTPLTIGDSTIGTFVRVDTSEAYFEVPPGPSGFGAKFIMRQNGGWDFDPQGIECYRLVNGQKRVVSNCSDTIKNSIQRGSMGGLAHSNAESRQAFFHSTKACRAINSAAYSEPFCAFSDNAEAIRLASSLYQPACMTPAKEKSATPAAEPASSAR